uniref:Uncharacterized protein n=1 Tax=Arundo donax TaxID=35708 RepID=A0A0A8ZXH4_ARUDO
MLPNAVNGVSQCASIRGSFTPLNLREYFPEKPAHVRLP